jgi:hypothetical protein
VKGRGQHKDLKQMTPIIEKTGNLAKITIEVDLTGSMMEMEDKICEALNLAGSELTGEALKTFDTLGQPLKFGDVKFTVQQKSTKDYETPYGRVPIERHIYQTNEGGKTYCPLDVNARIIKSSTPRFAQIVTSKYASQGAIDVQKDLEISNGRKISRSFIQNVAETIGAFAQAVEEPMDYQIPEMKKDEKVTIVAFSLDGTCMNIISEGYREAMTGTLSLYNAAGDRLHTIYLGAAPEYGKESFLQKLEREITKIKQKFPDAIFVGLADGALCNWKFLEQHASIRILDFYHATEYLALASEAFAKDQGARKAWLDKACHSLKHDEGGAYALLMEMEEKKKSKPKPAKRDQALQEKLDKAITYFTNQLGRMDYKKYTDQNLPIGSGVTEAACKTLIKQRLCNSGMKWKNAGAQIVISLRSMARTEGRWAQFWERFNSQGVAGLPLANQH